MNRIFCLFALLIGFTSLASAQQNPNDRPRLVVGITVDQMRQEYLYRFYNKFGEGGFKRLMSRGFMLKNAHYNYVPTVTGAGHASIYTGSTPSIHGIIGNDWYVQELGRTVYCADDDSVRTVGSASEKEGKMSPRRLLTTTITDELELFTQKRSKVIGLSIKDRGAIMPAGHLADAAYWYDGQTGKFITSTFYRSTLPVWVEKFNQLSLPDKYLNMVWQPVLPLDQYTEVGPDASPYESRFKGKTRQTFPYNLKELSRGDSRYELLSYTPFSDDLLTEMAKAAIDGEQMGQDAITDFLTVSFSAPDKLGHDVGPNSVELEDLYIRLDKNIEDLLNKLDQAAGAGNYVVFLTADHAIVDVPQYLVDNKIPAGYEHYENLTSRLNEYMKQYFPGVNLVKRIINEEVYLNHEVFSGNPRSGGVDMLVATELIMNFLLKQESIAAVYSRSTLRQGNYSEGGYKGMIIRGYNPKRSGDIAFVLESGWIESGKATGTTHGSPYTYDTHVPVLFYGFGIKPGTSVRYHAITDIAPTLSVMLNIKFPSGSTGQPIEELFER
jgi:predicted AlkP superfamily pyrophosphatase or phosphodiesterase